MYENYITVSGILGSLMKHPLLSNLSYADATSYALECLNNVGSLSILENKGEFVTIENYKGVLPFDFVTTNSKQVSVRRVNSEGDTFAFLPMYKSTDNFNINYSKDSRSYEEAEYTNTYTISGNIITTGFLEGKVEVSYYGLLVNESGEILIPREPFVIKAIEEYIKKEYFRILADLGKCDYRTYEKADQEYCWYIGKAQNSTKALDMAGRENLSRMINRLIDSSTLYDTGFKQFSNVISNSITRTNSDLSSQFDETNGTL